MKHSALNILHAYINSQLETINNLKQKIEKLEPAGEDQSIHLAYELHNIYCAYEDLFKEIAKTFENEIDELSRFHKSLLQRMQLNIKDIRPEVISHESYEILNEMLGFRHVFRHAYNYNLSPKKIKDLKEMYIQNSITIENDINNFLAFLEKNME